MYPSRDWSSTLDALGIAMAEYGADLRVVCWNCTFERYFPEHRSRISVGEHYSENLRRFYGARLDGPDLGQLECLVSEGVQRHLYQSAPFEFCHSGRRLRVSCVVTPSGSRIRLWQNLGEPVAERRSATPAFDGLDMMADGACVLDSQNRIVAANPRFRSLYDVPDELPIVGFALEDVVLLPWGHAVPDHARPAIRNGIRYDGSPFHIELPGDRWRRIVTRHSDEDHVYLVHGDSTQDKRREVEWRRLANHDPLTNLSNRRSLDAALQGSRPRYLVLIDLDHLKRINDVLGHPVGDECLVAVARVLEREAIRHRGVAFRIGGDEFALLLERSPEDGIGCVAEDIVRKVARLRGPALSVSVGSAFGSGPSLMSDCDRALYRAKGGGRNRCEMSATPEGVAGVSDPARPPRGAMLAAG